MGAGREAEVQVGGGERLWREAARYRAACGRARARNRIGLHPWHVGAPLGCCFATDGWHERVRASFGGTRKGKEGGDCGGLSGTADAEGLSKATDLRADGCVKRNLGLVRP